MQPEPLPARRPARWRRAHLDPVLIAAGLPVRSSAFRRQNATFHPHRLKAELQTRTVSRSACWRLSGLPFGPVRPTLGRLTACAISLPRCSIRSAVKPSRQKHRQTQPHPWPGQTMNVSNPQPLPELHLLAVSPFVPFQHFQNRVTKRDKTCQKVPESDIRSFLSGGADFLVCGFTGLSSPVFPRGGTGDWKVARTRRLESRRCVITVNV